MNQSIINPYREIDHVRPAINPPSLFCCLLSYLFHSFIVSVPLDEIVAFPIPENRRAKGKTQIQKDVINSCQKVYVPSVRKGRLQKMFKMQSRVVLLGRMPKKALERTQIGMQFGIPVASIRITQKSVRYNNRKI